MKKKKIETARRLEPLKKLGDTARSVKLHEKFPRPVMVIMVLTIHHPYPAGNQPVTGEDAVRVRVVSLTPQHTFFSYKNIVFLPAPPECSYFSAYFRMEIFL